MQNARSHGGVGDDGVGSEGAVDVRTAGSNEGDDGGGCRLGELERDLRVSGRLEPLLLRVRLLPLLLLPVWPFWATLPEHFAR